MMIRCAHCGVLITTRGDHRPMTTEPEFCSDECSLNFNRPLSELARREAAIRLSGAWIAA